MPTPKVILVATDFGEPSEAALSTAFEYAAAFQSEVVLVHAFEVPIVAFPDGAVVDLADLRARLMEAAKAGLDRIVSLHEGKGAKVRGIIKQGQPWRMVNEAADELGAGLIVLGTHGRRGIARALLGSVAEKVVRTAKVPVLTVHSEESAPNAP